MTAAGPRGPAGAGGPQGPAAAAGAHGAATAGGGAGDAAAAGAAAGAATARAVVRLRLANAREAEIALAALAPDNAGLAARAEGPELVLEVHSLSAMGMLRSLDDALQCLRAIR